MLKSLLYLKDNLLNKLIDNEKNNRNYDAYGGGRKYGARKK